MKFIYAPRPFLKENKQQAGGRAKSKMMRKSFCFVVRRKAHAEPHRKHYDKSATLSGKTWRFLYLSVFDKVEWRISPLPDSAQNAFGFRSGYGVPKFQNKTAYPNVKFSAHVMPDVNWLPGIISCFVIAFEHEKERLCT